MKDNKSDLSDVDFICFFSIYATFSIERLFPHYFDHIFVTQFMRCAPLSLGDRDSMSQKGGLHTQADMLWTMLGGTTPHNGSAELRFKFTVNGATNIQHSRTLSQNECFI